MAKIARPFRRRKPQARASGAAAAQKVPFQRAAKRTGDPRCPAQIQGSKRKTCCSSTTSGGTIPRYWGAKRARSALGDPAESLTRRDKSGGARDWASLADGPAGLIAELALANDVADYVRFRAVCRPWRQCSPDPRTAGLDGRFLPRRWMMLDKALARHRFLNLSTGECIRMDLPELDEQHTLLALTPDGLLLLLHEPSLVLRLLNPLTRQLNDLPPVTALLTPAQQRDRRSGDKLGESIRVSGVGIVVDASVVVAVSFWHPAVLAVAKPGDESWMVVDHTYSILSVLPFGGRFYCATGNGVMVLNISSDQQKACLRIAVERSGSLINFSSFKDSIHLVDNGGELMLVHRILWLGDDDDDDDDEDDDDCEEDDGNYKMKYEVYRVDLTAGILNPVKSFNGQAVFIGRGRAISVSAEALPSLAADTLYLGLDWAEKRRLDGYNLADGSNEPCHYDPWVAERVQPSTLVDCLSYCIQDSGRQLA